MAQRKKVTKGQATAERIIEVATDLFFEVGLYEITFAQITKRAGLTQPAVYRHFKDMDDLILGACQYWVGKAQRQIDSHQAEFDPAKLQLKAYVEQNLRFSLQHRAQEGLLLGLYLYAMRSPKMLVTYR